VWMAELMARRRSEYESYAPRFWRPAAAVEGQHADFMQSVAAEPNASALRSDHGFILAQRRGDQAFVDDFAVVEPKRWGTDGKDLLFAAWEEQRAGGADYVRVVTARLDTPKVELLVGSGLSVGEEWWIKDIEAAESDAPFGPYEEPFFTLLKIPAPPVYDPGGPVLLVPQVKDASRVGEIEDVAARLGCVIAIVPGSPTAASPGSLPEFGYDLVSQFYDGVPG
jgi:hypothetical protein